MRGGRTLLLVAIGVTFAAIPGQGIGAGPECDGQILTNRGFQQQMRFPSSVLAVDQFDPTPFAGAMHKMTTRGIRVATLGLLRGIDHTRAPEAPGALDDEQALLRANLFLASCLRWVLGRELPTMTALFDQG